MRERRRPNSREIRLISWSRKKLPRSSCCIHAGLSSTCLGGVGSLMGCAWWQGKAAAGNLACRATNFEAHGRVADFKTKFERVGRRGWTVEFGFGQRLEVVTQLGFNSRLRPIQQQHAGHDRVPGEMARKHRMVRSKWQCDNRHIRSLWQGVWRAARPGLRRPISRWYHAARWLEGPVGGA